jgi:carboxylesterase type B
MREAGYSPNNGLHDQKLGFRWVQRHIAGFGGDPNALTYFGCSIGAGKPFRFPEVLKDREDRAQSLTNRVRTASGFVHLQSEEPLFQRIAAWGGSGLMQPLPLGVAEIGYGMVVKTLGLDSLPPAEQVKELLRIPQDEFEAKVRDVHAPYMAWADGDVVPSVPTFSAIADPEGLKKVYPGVQWCPKMWMGSCSMDVSRISNSVLTNRILTVT